MKKYLTLLSGLFAIIFLSSCTKDFECECTYTETETGGGSTTTTSYTTSVTLKETTKDVARRNCLSTEETDTDTYGGTTYTYTYVSDCELK